MVPVVAVAVGSLQVLLASLLAQYRLLLAMGEAQYRELPKVIAEVCLSSEIFIPLAAVAAG